MHISTNCRYLKLLLRTSFTTQIYLIPKFNFEFTLWIYLVPEFLTMSNECLDGEGFIWQMFWICSIPPLSWWEFRRLGLPALAQLSPEHVCERHFCPISGWETEMHSTHCFTCVCGAMPMCANDGTVWHSNKIGPFQQMCHIQKQCVSSPRCLFCLSWGPKWSVCPCKWGLVVLLPGL